MQITITDQQLLAPVKSVTRASVEDWSNTIKSIAKAMAPVIALLWTLVYTIKNLVLQPKSTSAQLIRDAVNGVAALDSPSSTRNDTGVLPDNSVEKAVPVSVAKTETPKPAAKPRRSRRRSAKGAANTTPEVVTA